MTALFLLGAFFGSLIGGGFAAFLAIGMCAAMNQRVEDAADSALARDKFGPLVGSPLDDDLAIRHAWSQWSRGGTR